MKNTKINYGTILLLITMSLFLFCKGSKSPVLVQIEGEKITVASFKAAYNDMIDNLGLQLGATREDLIRIKEKSMGEMQSQPQQVQMIWQQLQPEAFLESLKYTKIINIEAKKRGFLQKKSTQRKIKYIIEQAVMQFFLSGNVDIPTPTESEIQSECDRIRNSSDNPMVQNMTASQCMEQAKRYLNARVKESSTKKLVKSISDSYRIKNNDKVIAKFLKGNLIEEKKAEPKKKKEVKKTKKSSDTKK